ncbi:hypothetical protein [Bremerella cremea]|uniref:hypothetical protein n=1 Tax=Bremerella cremea TaxID=1031537 RepID=UPI0011C01B13|nr:hypothetical protein [Bremerella cremea]
MTHRPIRLQLSLRSAFIAISAACLALEIAAPSAVGAFLAYQAIRLLLDFCLDLTDFINGDQPPTRRRRRDN